MLSESEAGVFLISRKLWIMSPNFSLPPQTPPQCTHPSSRRSRCLLASRRRGAAARHGAGASWWQHGQLGSRDAPRETAPPPARAHLSRSLTTARSSCTDDARCSHTSSAPAPRPQRARAHTHTRLPRSCPPNALTKDLTSKKKPTTRSFVD